MNTMKIRIPQIDGSVREITLTAEDAAWVRDDPAMIDYVHPLKIVDVYPDGRREPAEVTR
jgi:hypothetical protein